jgi:hypothetical protein
LRGGAPIYGPEALTCEPEQPPPRRASRRRSRSRRRGSPARR